MIWLNLSMFDSDSRIYRKFYHIYATFTYWKAGRRKYCSWHTINSKSQVSHNKHGIHLSYSVAYMKVVVYVILWDKMYSKLELQLKTEEKCSITNHIILLYSQQHFIYSLNKFDILYNCVILFHFPLHCRECFKLFSYKICSEHFTKSAERRNCQSLHSSFLMMYHLFLHRKEPARSAIGNACNEILQYLQIFDSVSGFLWILRVISLKTNKIIFFYSSYGLAKPFDWYILLKMTAWAITTNNKYYWKNKRPKGPHIVHLSTMCHLFSGLARAAILFFRSARKTQTW